MEELVSCHHTSLLLHFHLESYQESAHHRRLGRCLLLTASVADHHRLVLPIELLLLLVLLLLVSRLLPLRLRRLMMPGCLLLLLLMGPPRRLLLLLLLPRRAARRWRHGRELHVPTAGSERRRPCRYRRWRHLRTGLRANVACSRTLVGQRCLSVPGSPM